VAGTGNSSHFIGAGHGGGKAEEGKLVDFITTIFTEVGVNGKIISTGIDFTRKDLNIFKFLY